MLSLPFTVSLSYSPIFPFATLASCNCSDAFARLDDALKRSEAALKNLKLVYQLSQQELSKYQDVKTQFMDQRRNGEDFKNQFIDQRSKYEDVKGSSDEDVKGSSDEDVKTQFIDKRSKHGDFKSQFMDQRSKHETGQRFTQIATNQPVDVEMLRDGLYDTQPRRDTPQAFLSIETNEDPNEVMKNAQVAAIFTDDGFRDFLEDEIHRMKMIGKSSQRMNSMLHQTNALRSKIEELMSHRPEPEGVKRMEKRQENVSALDCEACTNCG